MRRSIAFLGTMVMLCGFLYRYMVDLTAGFADFICSELLAAFKATDPITVSIGGRYREYPPANLALLLNSICFMS
jgi:hypothetical protein